MARAMDRVIEWARDAHAMEEQAETMLSATAARLENYPELKRKLEEHHAQTRKQAELLKRELDRLGGGTSALKDMTGKMVALAQGMSGMFVGDEVVKAVLASYTFEQMEIASYKILIVGAEHCGDMQLRQTCETILREEEAMARWLEEHFPEITRRYLTLEETPGATSKH